MKRAVVLAICVALVASVFVWLQPRSRVIIVGAGLTGLTAAVELSYSPAGPHTDIIVVEAQERAGGRVVSSRTSDKSGASSSQKASHCDDGFASNDGTCTEIGATFIHGVDGNPVKTLADHYALPTVAIDYDKISVFDDEVAASSNSGARDVASWIQRLAANEFIKPVPEAIVDKVKDKVYDKARERFLRHRDAAFEAGIPEFSVEDGFRKALDNFLNTSTPIDDLPAEEQLERRLLSWHFYWEIVQDQVATMQQLGAFSYDASVAFRGPDHIFTNGIGGLIDALVNDFLRDGGKAVTGCAALHQVVKHSKESAPIRVLALGCPVGSIEAIYEGASRTKSPVRTLTTLIGDTWGQLKDLLFSAKTASSSRRRSAKRTASKPRPYAPTENADGTSQGFSYPNFAADHMFVPVVDERLPRGNPNDGDVVAMGVFGNIGEEGAGGLAADAVAVTVPLGAYLRTSEEAPPLRFEPPLPRFKQSSLRRLGCAATLKFGVKFSRRFWDSNQHYFGLIGTRGTSDAEGAANWNGDADHIEIFNIDAFRKDRVLIFEIEGAFAEAVSRTAAETNATHAFVTHMGEKLVTILDKKARSALRERLTTLPKDALLSDIMLPSDILVESVHINNYVHNRYIRCGFSYWRPGSDGDDNLNLAASLHNERLLFGGEHTTPDLYGNMHGAISEGQRVATAASSTLTSPGVWVGSVWRGLVSTMSGNTDPLTAAMRGLKKQRQFRHFKPAWCPQQCR